MLEIKACIRFWRSKRTSDQDLMSPATRVLVEDTIAHLEAYKTLLDKGTNTETNC